MQRVICRTYIFHWMLRLHAFSPHRLSLAVATSTGEGLVNLPRTWHTCTLEELHILSVQLSVSFLNSRNVTNTAWCWTLSGPWLRLVALRSSSGQTSTQIMYVCHCTWQVLATRPSPCMLVPQVTNAGVRRPKLVHACIFQSMQVPVQLSKHATGNHVHVTEHACSRCWQMCHEGCCGSCAAQKPWMHTLS